MCAQRYTAVPRTTLWLIGEGELQTAAGAIEIPPFYIGKIPITNAEFEAYAPDHGRAAVALADDAPVVGVSFAEAAGYCAWYADLSGKPFRLPSESEWEYACRGGTTTRFPWGDDPEGADPYVVDARTADACLPPLEGRRPNRFGVHDMLGMVWEWTCPEDAPAPGQLSDPDDAPGFCAIRGGSFRLDRTEMACSVRRVVAAGTRRDDLGFRIVRSLR